jgi:hypothetical protein
MSHKIEIYQQTSINEIATCTITDADLTKLNQLRSEGEVRKVRNFLIELCYVADEWTRGDTIDGDLPHYYEVDGEPFSAVDV